MSPFNPFVPGGGYRSGHALIALVAFKALAALRTCITRLSGRTLDTLSAMLVLVALIAIRAVNAIGQGRFIRKIGVITREEGGFTGNLRPSKVRFGDNLIVNTSGRLDHEFTLVECVNRRNINIDILLDIIGQVGGRSDPSNFELLDEYVWDRLANEN